MQVVLSFELDQFCWKEGDDSFFSMVCDEGSKSRPPVELLQGRRAEELEGVDSLHIDTLVVPSKLEALASRLGTSAKPHELMAWLLAAACPRREVKRWGRDGYNRLTTDPSFAWFASALDLLGALVKPTTYRYRYSSGLDRSIANWLARPSVVPRFSPGSWSQLESDVTWLLAVVSGNPDIGCVRRVATPSPLSFPPHTIRLIRSCLIDHGSLSTLDSVFPFDPASTQIDWQYVRRWVENVAASAARLGKESLASFMNQSLRHWKFQKVNGTYEYIFDW